jgi:hypothetical protein
MLTSVFRVGVSPVPPAVPPPGIVEPGISKLMAALHIERHLACSPVALDEGTAGGDSAEIVDVADGG